MRTTIVALFVFLFGLPLLQAQDTVTATIDNSAGIMPSIREDGVDPDLAYAGKTGFGQQLLAEDDGCIPAGTKFVYPKRQATPEDRAKNQAFLAKSGAARGLPCKGRAAKYLEPSPSLLLARAEKLVAESTSAKFQHETDLMTIESFRTKLGQAEERIKELELEVRPFWRHTLFWILVFLFLFAVIVIAWQRNRMRVLSDELQAARIVPVR